MQSLVSGVNLNLDTPADIINNFNKTYSEISDLKYQNDEKKRKQVEDDLLEQSKYFIQVGRDLIKQGVPSDKVLWAFKSPRTVMEDLKKNYDSYKQIIDTQIKDLSWKNFIEKYAGAGEFNRQEWEQDPIAVEKRLLENKAKKGEKNYADISKMFYGENKEEIKPEIKAETQNQPITTAQENIQPQVATQQPTNQTTITSQSPAVQNNVPSTKYYTIQKGDTLTKIAQNNNISIAELLKLNPTIKKDGIIYAGKTLNIPDKTISTTSMQTQSNITPPQTQTNIAGVNTSGLNIQENKLPENRLDIKISNLKKEKDRILNNLQNLNDIDKKGKTGEILFTRLLNLESQIDKLDIDAINFEQNEKLTQLKQDTANDIEKIQQRYNFKLLEKEVLNRQKLDTLKSEKGKTNYQSQINTLEKQFNLAKNLKEKSEISKKIREIEIKASGENINVNLPEIAKYEPFQQIIPEKEGNNYKIKIDGVEIPNILISKDGTKTRLEKYGIDVFWDKNANNKKGRLMFIRLNKPLKKENKSNEKNQIKKGKVGNINYSIEKQ